MDIQGEVIEIFSTQQVSASFQKREFVVKYSENPQYPEFIKFEVIQDKCAELDSFRVGDFVNVFFNLKGRAWTNAQGEKIYFNTIQAWKVVIKP